MTRFVPPLAALALCALTLPAFADSFASSASDSVSDSIHRSSDSVSDSSHSSTGDHHAQGDYKVTDVAEVDGQPAMVQLHLQPLTPAQGHDVFLTLPRAATAQGRVDTGAVVTALARPYGTEFAAGPEHVAFFLAVDDEWAREYDSKPVSM